MKTEQEIVKIIIDYAKSQGKKIYYLRKRNICINCNKVLKEKLWCDLECKQEFIEKYYSIHQLEVAIQNINSKTQASPSNRKGLNVVSARVINKDNFQEILTGKAQSLKTDLM